MSVNDTGQLTLLHASGEIITEEGPVSGTLPGIAKVRLDIGAEHVTASFTNHAARCRLDRRAGRASAELLGQVRELRAAPWRSPRGTGRYAHARGTGKLYGVIERVSDNLTVQTREGTLDY